MYYLISENKSQVAKAIDSPTIQFASKNWSHRKRGWTSNLLENLLLNFCQFLILPDVSHNSAAIGFVYLYYEYATHRLLLKSSKSYLDLYNILAYLVLQRA